MDHINPNMEGSDPSPQIGPDHKKIIWTGQLEWQDKNKVPGSNQQMVLRSLPCQVSIGQDESDINTTNWPSNLTMHLIPQNILKSPQLAPLMKSCRLLTFQFKSQGNETNLCKVMQKGFAGCINFHLSANDIHVLLLFYSSRRRAFVGIIPNDQPAFLKCMKAIVSEQRAKQQHQQQHQQQKMQQIKLAAAAEAPTTTATATTDAGSADTTTALEPAEPTNKTTLEPNVLMSQPSGPMT